MTENYVEYAVLHGSLRVNSSVSVDRIEEDIVLNYNKEHILIYNRRTAVLKDNSFKYYKKNGYDTDLNYWVNRFREELMAIL